MKVGVITIQNAINYGSTLQAYALQEALKDLGHDVVVIDYQNPKLNAIYRRNYSMSYVVKLLLKGHLRSGLSECKEINRCKRNDKYRRMLKEYDSYRENKLHLSYPVINENDEIFQQFDALICGSDQVWRTSIVGDQAVYYLDIPNFTHKKIAYAASGDSVSCKERINSIKRIRHISVREHELEKELKKMGLNDVVTVCDPTLLCDKSFWKRQLSVERSDNEYIFAYLMWDEPIVLDYIDQLSKEKGLPAVVIHRAAEQVTVNNKTFNTSSPQHFIDLLANAKYVINNSFHGLAMSIIYEKQFMVFPSDQRIENCLKTYRLQARSITKTAKLGDIDQPINWKEVDAEMKKEREFGIKFLENALD
ncbi:polysaccharide pyruvyl transferase family protein [Ruminococcus sp.]|uniref:polysaccharide pyruvyl transferase family protein n=1 Tax=Ruminococcus sp. TaxID=41978 RepID=UPI00388EB82B